jgi:hypothetical protein
MARPKRFTSAEFNAILNSLAVGCTEAVAADLGITPRALLKILGSEGISLRKLRKTAATTEPVAGGLSIRRSIGAPAAVYGAAALEMLPDCACRFPIGDPSKPDFSFCGAPKVAGRSYCRHHMGIAYEPRRRSRACDAAAAPGRAKGAVAADGRAAT